MQKFRRLEYVKRAGAPSQQEAWSIETGGHKDGAGGDGLPRRHAEYGCQAGRHRNVANCHGGQGGSMLCTMKAEALGAYKVADLRGS